MRKNARAVEETSDGEGRSFGREAMTVCLGLAAAILVVAIATHHPAGVGENAFGPLGAALADLLVTSLGIASLMIPAGFLGLAIAIHTHGVPQVDGSRAAASAVALIFFAILADLVLGTWRGGDAGGVLGGFSAELLEEWTGPSGAWLVACVGVALLSTYAAGQTLFGVVAAAGRGARELYRRGSERARRKERPAAARAASEPIVLGRDQVITPKLGPTAAVAADREPRPAPRISTPKAVQTVSPRRKRQVEMPWANGEAYSLPEADLLDPPVDADVVIDRESLIKRSQVLEAKLHTFSVKGRVVGIHPGPVITTYEFEPAPGIRVNRVTALADDLAMAMQARSVRILAPIPGKSVVGIEVSNARRETVCLREIISSDAFEQSKSPLALALGKDTTGGPAAGDLARMPHLLVAGATGAGKSVFLNTLLLSILMRSSPREVRLVLVDPKMLELATYGEIPHLLVPVITEAKKAVAVLENLVTEMNERYRLMMDRGVRNIDSYNKAVERDEPVIDLEAEGEGDDTETTPAAPVHQYLPRIVVIIDELADLMMTRRDCEEPITRLAQKARAAGIHMVIATQRPSVDVITGLIKANFPSRISFQVAGKVDSRTILDAMGAERLLGSGDMLFLPPGTSKLERLHGAYVSDDEIQRVTDFVRGQQTPRYQMELLEDDSGDDDGAGGGGSGEEQFDPMYDKAVQVVTDTGKASISYVQRCLQVGYNRAARMIESMEREGVVSSPDHRGTREVLVRRDYEE